MRVAPGIAGDQDRILRRQKLVGERGDELGIGAPARRRRKLIGRIAPDLVGLPMLRQRLALHHQIDRAARLALHDRRSPPQRLLDDHAGRQRPLPFQIGPHQARLVERLLYEMNVGIARADELVVGGVRRFAGHQQNGQPAAEQVVHAVCGVGGADVDMDQDALAAPGDQRIAGRHMGGGVLVRAAHDAGHCVAAFLAMRHLVDDWSVIGSKIAKQIIDADLVQTLEQVIGCGEIRNIGLLI